MIVKMKKLSLVVLEAYREESLDQLRKIGVLHLENGSGASEKLEELRKKRRRLERSLLMLPLEEEQKAAGEPAWQDAELDSCLAIAGRVADLVEREREIGEELDRLQREAEKLLPWGDFDPDEIRNLREKGILVKLFELNREDLARIPERVSTFILSETRGRLRLAAVFLEDEGIPGLEEVPLPPRGLRRIDEAKDALWLELGEIQREKKELARKRAGIEASIRSLESDIEFEEARAGMGVDEQLAYLTGYVPDKRVDEVRKAASENGWALLVDEPGEEDPVPTLIENPKPISIIQPVFKLLGTVPGYRETDISFWFLLFFSLFFAMLIGDAGYGLLFLGLTVAARQAVKKAPSGPFILMYVLSISTVIWGLLSGTWFGIESLARNPLLSRFVIPQIASFGWDNAQQIMIFCFIIGAVQLSVAHLVNFLRFLPHPKAFAELGWLSVVCGMYFVIRYIVLQLPLNPAGIWLVAAGLFLVVVFAKQRGKFLKGLLIGIANLPLQLLDSIGAFSDIISYVRLYAVGLATVEVAKSFNAMAGEIGFGLPIGLASALILFFGHALNILMGAMAVIVHGIRLNMLEFSGHLGMEWTGIPYKPFKTERKET